MTWLTSTWAFYGGLPIFLALPIVAFLFFATRSSTKRTPIRELRDDIQRLRDEDNPDFPGILAKLNGLLEAGYDRSCLVITFKKTELSLQFRKYIHAKGDYGIELGFPLAPWSERYVPALRDHCAANGIAFTVGPEVEGDSMEFLHVDFGKDSRSAFRMAEAVATEIFQIPLDSEYVWEFSSVNPFGVNPFGELIDDPRQRPPSPDEALQRRLEKFHAESGTYLTDWFLNFLGVALYFFGRYGLLYSLLWKSFWTVTTLEPGWGSVSASLLDVTIEPRVFDLVCLGMIIVFLTIRRASPLQRVGAANLWEEKDNFEPPQWLRLAGRILPRDMRLPVIVVATIAFWFV